MVGYQGTFTPPLYWYSIYSFQDGLPHDTSRQFREFYASEVLSWSRTLERMIVPPLGSGSTQNAYIEAQIVFARLKYRRVILGERKAGLQEAMGWADSSQPDLQQLAVQTLQEIADPDSIRDSRNWQDPGSKACAAAPQAPLRSLSTAK